MPFERRTFELLTDPFSFIFLSEGKRTKIMIESKNLIPYLRYSLKVEMEGKKCNVAWMSTKNIAVHRPGGIGDYKKIAWKYASHNIKPILKPKKQIVENLTSNYDRCEQWEQEWIDHILDFQDKLDEANFDACPYDLMQHLLENHFDVFDLIPKGLAVEEKIKEKASTPDPSN